MTDNDTCIRCFLPETIQHLLLDCPYSRQVWALLGISPEVPLDVLDCRISQAELEIRADLISALVFRQQNLQPEVLVQTGKGRLTVARINMSLATVAWPSDSSPPGAQVVFPM